LSKRVLSGPLTTIRDTRAAGIEPATTAEWAVSVTFDEGLGEADIRLFGDGGGVPERVQRPSCVVVFDGVLFDRENAAPSGESAGDTDAVRVAAAYESRGPGLLAELRGSFALILWDRQRRQLICARDPLGSQPLFYADQRDGLVLASSLRRLLSHPTVSRELNPAALVDHLCHRWPDPAETPFSGVRRVPVGHRLSWQAGRRRIEPYWKLSTPETWIGDDELGEFDQLLERAVGRQLSLGPAAVFLSGGFDSVSIAAVAADMAKEHREPVPWALSLAFPDPECNEEEIQRSVAQHLGIPQTLMPFDQAVAPAGFVGAGIALSASLPLPLLSAWRPAYMRLAATARDRGCAVVLTGSGGDEWLTVNPFHMADLLRRGDILGASRFGRTIVRSYRRSHHAMIRFLIWEAGLKPLVLLAGRRGVGRIAPQLVSAKRRNDLQNLTPPWVRPSGELAKAVKARIEWRVEQRGREPEPRGGHGFYFRGLDWPILHPERSREQEEDFEIFRRLDLKIGHPYWDPDLISFLCRIPPKLLIMDGREKGLVREAVNRRFPGMGFERQRKVSAQTFFQNRLKRELDSAWRQMGGATALGVIGVVDPPLVAQSAAAILSNGDPRRLFQLWEVMILEAWVREQL
jgi:asparagine synthetase B (glutamine-hydrolysing)